GPAGGPAHVLQDHTRRSALVRRFLRPGGRHHLGHWASSRAHPPGALAATRTRWRSVGREGPVHARATSFPGRVRAAGQHHRRQPRGAHHRPSGHGRPGGSGSRLSPAPSTTTEIGWVGKGEPGYTVSLSRYETRYTVCPSGDSRDSW